MVCFVVTFGTLTISNNIGTALGINPQKQIYFENFIFTLFTLIILEQEEMYICIYILYKISVRVYIQFNFG